MSARGRVRQRLLDVAAAAIQRVVRQAIRYERLHGQALLGDPARLRVASTAVLNDALINTVSGSVTIGEHAFFGNGVSVLTGTHDPTKFGLERQLAVPATGHDIVIEDGAWIASNATILGPCVIGRHAVVAAGALVAHDVEPYTVVAGVPARAVRRLEPPVTG